jgi:hypothetical protein
VSLKSRLRRLAAGVRWLETEGVLRRWELRRTIAEKQRAIAEYRARPKARPALRVVPTVLGISSASARKHPDAAPRAAPQGEVVQVPAAPPQPPPSPPPRSPLPPKPRWTKDIRPGPHDVLTWDEVLQVPWVNEMEEDDGKG